jgi:vacuolar-type H+-ATPase subunit I/STV1
MEGSFSVPLQSSVSADDLGAFYRLCSLGYLLCILGLFILAMVTASGMRILLFYALRLCVILIRINPLVVGLVDCNGCINLICGQEKLWRPSDALQGYAYH